MARQLRLTHRPTAALAVVVLAAASAAVPAPVASATAYRYWTYWSGTGSTWTFAQAGPASSVPADGSVEGWRFALSTGTSGQAAQPRIAPGTAFDRFCGDREAGRGRKRVAIVFDFGSSADAPAGQSPPASRGICVVTEPSASGSDILAAAADVRVQDGLVCAIAGYPAGECAPAVDPTPTPTPRPTHARRHHPPPEPTRSSGADSADTGGSAPVAPAPDPTPHHSRPPSTTPKPTPRDSRHADPAESQAPASSAAAQVPSEAAPVFVEGDAHQDPPGGSRLGLVAALLALAGLGGFLAWRRFGQSGR